MLPPETGIRASIPDAPRQEVPPVPRWLIYLIAILVVLAILILLAEHVAFNVH